MVLCNLGSKITSPAIASMFPSKAIPINSPLPLRTGEPEFSADYYSFFCINLRANKNINSLNLLTLISIPDAARFQNKIFNIKKTPSLITMRGPLF